MNEETKVVLTDEDIKENNLEEVTQPGDEVTLPAEESDNVATLALEVELDNPGKKNWIGDERIKSFNEDGEETIVLMKNGRTYRLRTLIFNKMATEKQNENGGHDPEIFKLSIIAEDIIGLLEKIYDLKHSEIPMLLQFIEHGTKNDMSYAVRALFGKSTNEVKLSEIKKVLKDNASKMAEIKEVALKEARTRMENERQ